jgi:putative nucleotidyltransferase with HDIG domain
MSANDQRHSLQVLRILGEMGETDHDLLTAALLHDVGKALHPLRLWERPMVVLIRQWRPATAVRWGRQAGHEPWGWKRPFVIYEQHPTWGAEMAQAAGCSPLTVWLIRWHQDQPETDAPDNKTELLVALQRADNAN